MIGAAAFWSGTGRITVTIAVIMLEITGLFLLLFFVLYLYHRQFQITTAADLDQTDCWATSWYCMYRRKYLIGTVFILRHPRASKLKEAIRQKSSQLHLDSDIG